MRTTLDDLCRPEYDDYNDAIEFDIAETTFNFTTDDLNEDIGCG